MKQNLRVINILPLAPAYEYIKDDRRPPINWDTKSGRWVGLFRGDWGDFIGREVLKVRDELDYEFWRLDLRTDKIYSYTFENGLIHRIFPARQIKKYYGFKYKPEVVSPQLIESLRKMLTENTILHLSGTGNCINREIIKCMPHAAKVIQFHSRISTPYIEYRRMRKNLAANIFYYLQHRQLLKNRTIAFVYNNSRGVKALAKYHPVGIERIFMGCDFDSWKPGNKIQSRRYFNIKPGIKVFSMASRLSDIKQVDKVIEIFTSIDRESKYGFKLMIAGHGERNYEDYLKTVGLELLKKGKLVFTGFLKDEEMLRLYQASDLFISASKTEGGPVSVVKAAACETPIMAARVNGVDDILEQHGAGILVGAFDYKQWQIQILQFLKDRLPVKLMDRKKAEEIFNWRNISKRFIDIYRSLKVKP
jgi:glycosyltransferase involved in cell wall biosynthesis